jgi:hypothetical protein
MGSIHGRLGLYWLPVLTLKLLIFELTDSLASHFDFEEFLDVEKQVVATPEGVS